MNLKELSEELSSYISDAEKLELVVEAFREMENTIDQNHMGDYVVNEELFDRLKAIINDD